MNELGEWLVSAREVRGLTLEDAERDTRISRRYLQALESGDFDVIPAPVYARGFLRSYAQYLGLDPQEAMARYPRDDGPGPYSPPPRQSAPPPDYPPERAPARAPFGGAPAQPQQSRPPWRRPGPVAASGGGVQPVPMRQQPEPDDYYPEDDEPTIGVDIGVPVPSRRLRPDPAAQTRSMVVLLVAVVAIGAILALAFAISRFGGGDDEGGLIPPADDQAVNGDLPAVGDDTGDTPVPVETPAATDDGPGALEPAPSGVVPALEGQTEEAALELIAEAGLTPNVRYEPHEGTPGIVLHQSPEAGTQREPGDPMTIIVSQEP